MTQLPLWSYLDLAGNVAIPARYLVARAFNDDGVALVANADGRMGAINTEGAEVVACAHDHILRFVDGIAQVNQGGWLDDRGNVKGGKWGYIKANGDWVVEPSFGNAFAFEEGRATVFVEKKAGVIDTSGAWIVEPTYSYLGWHHEGLAVFSDGSKDGYLDLNGDVAITPRFDEGMTFFAGMARVKLNGKWGVAGKNGDLLHDAKYERIGEGRQGACWAIRDGGAWLLTNDGRELGPFQEIRMCPRPDEGPGIWPIKKDDTWGWLRHDGTIFGHAYESTMGFLWGAARAVKDGKWGYVDESGAVSVPFQYEGATPWSKVGACVQQGGLWGMIKPSGEMFVAATSEQPANFNHGRLRICRDNRYGFVDENGAEISPCTWDAADRYARDRAAVLSFERIETVAVPGAHVLPAGGLENGVFDEMGKGHMISVVGWGAELDIPQELLATRILDSWQRGVETAGKKLYTESRWLSRFSCYVRCEGLHAPKADIASLVAAFAEKLPVAETLFSHWGFPYGTEMMGPMRDPRMPRMVNHFDDFPSYWECVWGDGDPPASENAYYLKGALQKRDGDLGQLEERHMPLWHPDVRVCMGALQNQGEVYLDRDARTAEIEKVVADAISARFESVWIKPDLKRWTPALMMRDGSEGLEKIRYENRTGYCFAVRCK
ncbi:MAG: WG repeat-containing protein, partial [Myxococcota bacterium]